MRKIMEFSNKHIWKITFPVLVSLLMEHAISLTDTAYLGRVGEVELGASALAGVFYLVLYMLGFGFSIGAQVMIARRNGEGAHDRIGAIFVQGCLFLFLLAGILFTLSHLYAPLLLRGLIESDAVFQATVDYIDWRVYGFFFSFISAMFRAFYVGTTHTKILTANSLVMVGTNVVLNYFLIFGKCGFPELGIKGAAIASSISELVSLLFFIIYTLKRVDYQKYRLFSDRRFEWHTLKPILSVSIWIMIQNGLAFCSWFIFFIAMEHHGERPLAVTNVVRSISSFLFLFVQSFASTSSSLVSNLIGMGEGDRVLPLCRRMIRLSYAIVLPLAGLIALFPEIVLRIYTDNEELIAASVPSLWVMLSSYLLAVPGFIFFMSVSGTGNTNVALRFEICSISVYTAYVLWLVWFREADVAICWTSELVYDAMILLTYFYLKRGTWKLKRI